MTRAIVLRDFAIGDCANLPRNPAMPERREVHRRDGTEFGERA